MARPSIFNWLPAEIEVINDINGELINLYRVVKRHLEEFVYHFKWTLSSREVFKWLHGAYIERPDWLDCMKRYDRPHTLFYLDPPVFGNRGIRRSFRVGRIPRYGRAHAQSAGQGRSEHQ